MKVWFDIVTKADAKALVKWWRWGGPMQFDYFIQKSKTNTRFYAVIQVKRTS